MLIACSRGGTGACRRKAGCWQPSVQQPPSVTVSNCPITVIINNNNSLGQILWEQMVLGYPEHGVRYSEFAQSWLRGQPHKAAIASTMFKDRISPLQS